jgi:hypothetical protein
VTQNIVVARVSGLDSGPTTYLSSGGTGSSKDDDAKMSTKLLLRTSGTLN